MATYNLTGNGIIDQAIGGTLTAGTAVNDGFTVREMGTIRRRKLDFKRFKLKNAGTAYAQNDIFGMIPVRRGEIVRAVWLNVLKQDTTDAVTVTVGDALTSTNQVTASATGFIDTFTIGSATSIAGVIKGGFIGAGSYFATNASAVILGSITGRVVTGDGTINVKLTSAALPVDSIIELVADVVRVWPDVNASGLNISQPW